MWKGDLSRRDLSRRNPGGFELTGEMKLYLGVVFSHCIKPPDRLGEENRILIVVVHDVSALDPDKILQLPGVFRCEPAGAGIAECFESAVGTVFMFETVGDDVELQISHGTDDFSSSPVLYKKLGDPLFGELSNPLVELLGFHGIRVDKLPEDLRRKTGNPPEGEFLSLGQGVADLQITAIVEPHHVSGKSLGDHVLALRHEVVGCGKTNIPSQSHVSEGLVFLEFTGTDPEKGDPITVTGIQVCMNFEDK